MGVIMPKKLAPISKEGEHLESALRARPLYVSILASLPARARPATRYEDLAIDARVCDGLEATEQDVADAILGLKKRGLEIVYAPVRGWAHWKSTLPERVIVSRLFEELCDRDGDG